MPYLFARLPELQDAYDPIVDAAARSITVNFAPLESVRSVWIPAARTIAVSNRLDVIDRRYSVAHQLQHATVEGLQGYAPNGHPRDEDFILLMTARRLLSLYELGEALKHTDDAEQVAQHLYVPVHALATRLDGLTPTERAALGSLVTRLFWNPQALMPTVLRCGRFEPPNSPRIVEPGNTGRLQVV